MERARARILSIGVAALVVGALIVSWYLGRRKPSGPALAIPGDGGVSVTAEVLNATDVDGLAREVTRRLRSRGIDVVYFGSSPDRRDRDSTIIVIRRGDSAAAVLVRSALGAGRVVVDLDPDRLLDVSVVVGRDVTTTLHGHP